MREPKRSFYEPGVEVGEEVSWRIEEEGRVSTRTRTRTRRFRSKGEEVELEINGGNRKRRKGQPCMCDTPRIEKEQN